MKLLKLRLGGGSSSSILQSETSNPFHAGKMPALPKMVFRVLGAQASSLQTTSPQNISIGLLAVPTPLQTPQSMQHLFDGISLAN